MFINETKVDLEMNLRMNENMTGKRSRIMLVVVGLLIFCCGLMTLLLELLSPSEEGADYFLPILCFAFTLLLLSFAALYKLILKKTLKKLMQGKESKDRYVFNESGYEKVTLLNDGTVSTSQGTYDGFTEAKEYKDMMILFINKTTVFPIAKDGMIEGSWEEFSSFINRKLKDRYKLCCKLK